MISGGVAVHSHFSLTCVQDVRRRGGGCGGEGSARPHLIRVCPVAQCCLCRCQTCVGGARRVRYRWQRTGLCANASCAFQLRRHSVSRHYFGHVVGVLRDIGPSPFIPVSFSAGGGAILLFPVVKLAWPSVVWSCGASSPSGC